MIEGINSAVSVASTLEFQTLKKDHIKDSLSTVTMLGEIKSNNVIYDWFSQL